MRSRFGWVLLLAAAGILGYQILLPPIVGLADNGDFGRITWFYRLTPEDETDRYFRYVVGRFRYDASRPIQLPEGPTSEHLPVAVPFLLNRIVSKDGLFDIRMAGLTHGALMLLALYLALPMIEGLRGWRRVLAGVLVLFVFADVGYVQYCNSLYTDAAAMVYLLLTVVVGLRILADAGTRRWNYALFTTFLALFVCSKSQHSLLAIPIVAGVLLVRPWPGRARVAAWAAAIVALVGFMLAMPSREYRTVASYNVLFYGILPNVAWPEGALDEFGLERWLSSYKGSSAYSDTTGLKSPLVRQRIEQKVTQLHIAFYFLRHPGVAWTLMSTGLSQGHSQKLSGWGNFTRESGRGPGESSQAFSGWSLLRQGLFQLRPAAQLAFLVLSVIAIWMRYRRHDWRYPAAALILLVMAGMSLGIGCLADVLDPQRHLFVFIAIVDIVFVLACAAWLGVSASLPETTPVPVKARKAVAVSARP